MVLGEAMERALCCKERVWDLGSLLRDVAFAGRGNCNALMRQLDTKGRVGVGRQVKVAAPGFIHLIGERRSGLGFTSQLMSGVIAVGVHFRLRPPELRPHTHTHTTSP